MHRPGRYNQLDALMFLKILSMLFQAFQLSLFSTRCNFSAFSLSKLDCPCLLNWSKWQYSRHLSLGVPVSRSFTNWRPIVHYRHPYSSIGAQESLESLLLFRSNCSLTSLQDLVSEWSGSIEPPPSQRLFGVNERTCFIFSACVLMLGTHSFWHLNGQILALKLIYLLHPTITNTNWINTQSTLGS